jgi:site-specific recombinase XerD
MKETFITGGIMMTIANSIVNYRRHLKRRNYSAHTVKNYMNTLKHFVLWLDVTIEQVTHKKIVEYIDALLDKRLSAKTINCHLDSIRGFYEHLCNEEQLGTPNPVKRGYALRLSRPLPRYLRDEQVVKLFGAITSLRDQAIGVLMLRCGLRVEEVANLTLAAIDFKQRKIVVQNGKGRKDRVVYISNDSHDALVRYLAVTQVHDLKNFHV